MKHYTFVDQVGNRIFHRYWDGKQRKQEVIKSFPIELYVKGKDATSHDIFGNPLSKIEFSDIDDARDFINSYKQAGDIYGQTSLSHQFIASTYKDKLEFDINNFVIANIDIETKINGGGFPYPHLAAQEITAITVKEFGKGKKYYTFGCKDYKPKSVDVIYTHSNSEEEMFAKFLGYWRQLDPDILTGWNVQGFDVPYLVNRITKVLGKDNATRLSPFHMHTNKVFSEFEIQAGQQSYRILGITIFDYIELYKKFKNKTLESYRLDFVAEYELKENKLDYSEYGNLDDLYNKNYELFVDYNIHDVNLVNRLDEKLNYMFLAITIGFIGKVKFHEIFGQVKFWDTLIYNELLQDNIQISPQKHNHTDGIEGAYVKEPIPGKYKWVVSFDLTSLYPSIIRQYNMSPETLKETAANERILDKMIDMSYNTQLLKERNLTMVANGAKFSREKQGFMPRITAKMFSERKRYKNMMLSVKKELELVKAEMNKRGIEHG